MKINPAMQAYTAHIQKKPAGMEDGKPGVNFGDLLKQELNKVNELQLRAEEANMQLITGEAESIHSVMLAAERQDWLELTYRSETNLLKLIRRSTEYSCKIIKRIRSSHGHVKKYGKILHLGGLI